MARFRKTKKGAWNMSCEDCNKIQDLAFDKNIPETTPIVYVRVGNSNMALVGCKKHCKEVVDKLRK